MSIVAYFRQIRPLSFRASAVGQAFSSHRCYTAAPAEETDASDETFTVNVHGFKVRPIEAIALKKLILMTS